MPEPMNPIDAEALEQMNLDAQVDREFMETQENLRRIGSAMQGPGRGAFMAFVDAERSKQRMRLESINLAQDPYGVAGVQGYLKALTWIEKTIQEGLDTYNQR